MGLWCNESMPAGHAGDGGLTPLGPARLEKGETKLNEKTEGGAGRSATGPENRAMHCA